MQSRVVIQDNTADIPRWLSFTRPVDIVCANKLSEVPGCWKRIESGTRRGLYTVGFVSYEAAPAFDSSLPAHELRDFPYLWFARYKQCTGLDSLPDVIDPDYSLGDWRHSVSQSRYFEAVAKIKQHIRAGDSYQINYTHKVATRFYGNSWALFVDLCHAQHAHYSAYLDLGRYQVLSVSPELFFLYKNGRLLAKPMKGTIARGQDAAEDEANADWLHSSDKNRAENLMIVDMLRNDMGRIAQPGSVRVNSLFDIESYPTLHQMTSSIESNTVASLTEIFTAMFPCASVTGAPKTKTMEIITQLEPEGRGIYTGSIGFIKPDGDAQFNVAIRTILIDSNRHRAAYGTGGGIVWDSDAVSEYNECETKTAIVKQAASNFKLLETLLWQPVSGYFLLDYHLQRLQTSADFFSVKIDINLITEKLHTLSISFNTAQKVRLTVGAGNNIELDAQDIGSLQDKTVVLDKTGIDTRSVFCCHKTTQRNIYRQVLARNPGFDDVILTNRDGLVTESTFASLAVKIDGQLVTPAGSCGLLAGVFRRHLLEQGILKETEISTQDLLNASQVYLLNSVRGWMPLYRHGENCWQIQQPDKKLFLRPAPESA